MRLILTINSVAEQFASAKLKLTAVVAASFTVFATMLFAIEWQKAVNLCRPKSLGYW